MVDVLRPITLGGVPEDIFYNGTHGIIPGESGKTRLKMRVRPYEVEIADFEDSTFHFNALVVTENLRGKTMLTLDINNKGYQSDLSGKHPDIHPSRLLEKAIDYFESEGVHIEVIQGYWLADPKGDNYTQYRRMLNGTGSPSEEDKKRAAFSTWTGKQALKYGFSKITWIQDQDDAVLVYFERPTPS